MVAPAEVPQPERRYSPTRKGQQMTRGEYPQTKIFSHDGVFRAGYTCQAGEVKQPYADTKSTIEATED